MIVATLRSFRARLARTILTVAGIAIGIVALVVVGSLAERLETIVTRSTALGNGTIFAFASGRALYGRGSSTQMRDDARRIAGFPGVRSVVPEVVVPYATGFADGGRFGPPALVFGLPYAARREAAGTLAIGRGRDFGRSERRVAVVGSDFASASHVSPGATIALYGSSYAVVGTLAKSFTVFDAAVVVPLADARTLLGQLLPASAPVSDTPDASALMVFVRPNADAGLIARRISLLTALHARDPASVAGDVRSTLRIFDAIIFGAALVALLVGAFSIVNTMTIAVSERTREIGIRKAIGAGDGDILREFVAEAAAIGALGGASGLVVAAVVVTAVNAHNAGLGDLELFSITPRLALGAFAFAVVLSIVAGLLPAVRAARLDPTDALRRVA